MSTNLHAAILIAIMSLVTIALRFIPFLVFSKRKTPEYITYLGKYLPYAIMSMLVVYCLKDVNFSSFSSLTANFIAVLFTIFVHLYKKNTLLSIILGTVCYMLLIQFVF